MSLVNAETKIATLLVDYLETRRTDLGLPASGTLPFIAEPTIAEFTRPSVQVYVPDFKLPHPKIVEATVEVHLHTERDPTATTGTTLANERAWLAALRAALSDETSTGFYGYVTALTTTDTDWQLRGFKLTGGGTDLDPETRHVVRKTAAVCWFRSTETTV